MKTKKTKQKIRQEEQNLTAKVEHELMHKASIHGHLHHPHHHGGHHQEHVHKK